MSTKTKIYVVADNNKTICYECHNPIEYLGAYSNLQSAIDAHKTKEIRIIETELGKPFSLKDEIYSQEAINVKTDHASLKPHTEKPISYSYREFSNLLLLCGQENEDDNGLYHVKYRPGRYTEFEYLSEDKKTKWYLSKIHEKNLNDKTVYLSHNSRYKYSPEKKIFVTLE